VCHVVILSVRRIGKCLVGRLYHHIVYLHPHCSSILLKRSTDLQIWATWNGRVGKTSILRTRPDQTRLFTRLQVQHPSDRPICCLLPNQWVVVNSNENSKTFSLSWLSPIALQQISQTIYSIWIVRILGTCMQSDVAPIH